MTSILSTTNVVSILVHCSLCIPGHQHCCPQVIFLALFRLIQGFKLYTYTINIYKYNLTEFIFFSALCCDKVTAVTEDSFIKSNSDTLGDYSLYTIVPEYNGNKVYSQDNNPGRCLKAKADGRWMIGLCSDLAGESG